MGVLAAQGGSGISRDEVVQCHKEGRQRKESSSKWMGLSIRDGGLQSIEQIWKIEPLDESWTWNFKFYNFWQHGFILTKSMYMAFSASADLQTLVLCYMCWLEDEPSPATPYPSFSCLFLKRSIYSVLKNLVFPMPGRRKEKADFHFFCYSGLTKIILLRLNHILLLRTPVRSSSWSDADFAALLVPPWNSIAILMCRFSPEFLNTPVLFVVHGIAAEREGNNSQTGSRRLILVLPSVQASAHSTTQPKSTTHVPQMAFSYSLQFKSSGWYLKPKNLLFSMSFQESQIKKKDKSGHQS